MWCGDTRSSATSYEYHTDGRLARSVTVAEPEWTDNDRALVVALRAEQAATCATCGHPMDLCRDPKTAGTWAVVEEICQPGRVAQAVAENHAERRTRGLVLYTRSTKPDR